jgi:hypothetical protein
MTSSSKKKKDKKKDFQVGTPDICGSRRETNISSETEIKGRQGGAQSRE